MDRGADRPQSRCVTNPFQQVMPTDRPTFRRRLLVALLASAAVGPTRVLAQAYPSRSVGLIVGTPPGGPTDVSARII
jgi:hypothetical protein